MPSSAKLARYSQGAFVVRGTFPELQPGDLGRCSVSIGSIANQPCCNRLWQHYFAGIVDGACVVLWFHEDRWLSC